MCLLDNPHTRMSWNFRREIEISNLGVLSMPSFTHSFTYAGDNYNLIPLPSSVADRGYYYTRQFSGFSKFRKSGSRTLSYNSVYVLPETHPLFNLDLCTDIQYSSAFTLSVAGGAVPPRYIQGNGIYAHMFHKYFPTFVKEQENKI